MPLLLVAFLLVLHAGSLQGPAEPRVALASAHPPGDDHLRTLASLLAAEEERLLLEQGELAVILSSLRSEFARSVSDGWERALNPSRTPVLPPQPGLAASLLTVSTLEEDLERKRAALRTALADAVVAALDPEDRVGRDDLAAALGDMSDLAFSATLRGLQFTGAPYRFGAAGPSAYDCSGFTRTVFAPWLALRSKAAYQFEDLGPSRSALPSPGDLLFFSGGPTASGPLRIGHVGMYLGAGVVLHASPSRGVHVAALASMRPPVAWSTPPEG